MNQRRRRAKTPFGVLRSDCVSVNSVFEIMPCINRRVSKAFHRVIGYKRELVPSQRVDHFARGKNEGPS